MGESGGFGRVMRVEVIGGMLPYFSQLRQAALNLQMGGEAPPSFPFPPPFPVDPLMGFRFGGGPRFVAEEPKPQHSYIGLIAMAILSSPEHKMVLSDIYQWILDNYPYFRTRGPGWRNSIRHNLSLNDCFVKSGRSANGKGHYWAIHPANVEDFRKGDFRRRRAQRKVRKHMGLSVPDEEDDSDDSPAPTPLPGPQGHPPLVPPHPFAPGLGGIGLLMRQEQEAKELRNLTESLLRAQAAKSTAGSTESQVSPSNSSEGSSGSPGGGSAAKKGKFDMESLLAPDRPVVPPPLPALFGLPAFQAGLWQLGLGGAAETEGSDRSDAAQWQETFAKIMARSYAAKHRPHPTSPPST